MENDIEYLKAKDAKEKIVAKYMKKEDGSYDKKSNVHGIGISREGKNLDGKYMITIRVLKLSDLPKDFPKEVDGFNVKVEEGPMASINW